MEPKQPRFRPTMLGPLSIITPPADGPYLDIELTKKHCRIEDDYDNDLVEEYIRVAAKWCEQQIPGHRQLLQATYQVPVEAWIDSRRLMLPRPPLQQVNQIQYYDYNGTLQVLATSYYLVGTPWRGAGFIQRAPFQIWPPFEPDRQYPILVTFTCGYVTGVGCEPYQIPETIRQAMRLHVRWQHANRGEIETPMPKAIQDHLDLEDWGSYA